ncbi:MAG: hypothetical protein ACK4OM_02010 [Alphaproteobacteria bacterium]
MTDKKRKFTDIIYSSPIKKSKEEIGALNISSQASLQNGLDTLEITDLSYPELLQTKLKQNYITKVIFNISPKNALEARFILNEITKNKHLKELHLNFADKTSFRKNVDYINLFIADNIYIENISISSAETYDYHNLKDIFENSLNYNISIKKFSVETPSENLCFAKMLEKNETEIVLLINKIQTIAKDSEKKIRITPEEYRTFVNNIDHISKELKKRLDINNPYITNNLNRFDNFISDNRIKLNSFIQVSKTGLSQLFCHDISNIITDFATPKLVNNLKSDKYSAEGNVLLDIIREKDSQSSRKLKKTLWR